MSNDAASEFAEACGDQRWFVDEGWVQKPKSVDNLQLLAERGGYVDAIGQDEVQALMSEAFATMPDLPSDYVTQMLRQWEIWDPRDRWRHTGELPPASGPAPVWPTPQRYTTPASTVDAFWFVLRCGDPEKLATWLAQHPRDAEHLHGIWRARCTIAA